jgi:hypothetical protein
MLNMVKSYDLLAIRQEEDGMFWVSAIPEGATQEEKNEKQQQGEE